MKIPKALQRLEHDEQRDLFAWAELEKGKRPELALMFAIPNFSGRLGKVPPLAAIKQGAKLKAEGRKAGVPDVFLPVSRGSYHGLFVEMKRVGATASDISEQQADWHDALMIQGYAVRICHGFDEARVVIDHYLKLKSK